MKPIKIMRYGGSARFQPPKPEKPIGKIVIAVIAVLLLIVLAAFVIYKVTTPQPEKEEKPVNMTMQDGIPVKVDLNVNDACTLTLPKAIRLREVTFTSTDDSVIRVDAAGHADALKEGKATVTATARNFKAECDFTVKEPVDVARNELTTANIANIETLRKNMEQGSANLYSITVNRRTNVVTVYTYDEKGEYTVPVRAMVASCGMSGADITITGDFSIYFQEPWHPLFGGVYGMFTSGFEGAYLFHSVPYEIYRHDALEAAEFNKLGQNASQGCVRMMVSDVYWIWKNCPLYTPVHVIDADSSADPLGKPRTVKLPANAVWDPTDKTEGNPYLDKVPTLTCAEDVEVSTGTQVDPMEGVSATDMFGNDVTDRVVVAGEVLRDKPGTYYLTYSFTDEFHRKTTATRTVTVVEK